MSASVVNAIFSKKFLELVHDGSHSELLSQLASTANVRPLAGERLGPFFERVYATLVSDYRCEYVIKNEIANKLFRARHNPSRSSLLTEVRVATNRIDLVIINGTVTAYEIKTEFDSLNRLNAQLEAYLKVFPKVCIVAAPIHISSLCSQTDQRVGIIEYTAHGTFSIVRRVSDNTDNVEPGSIFEILRMPEFLASISAEFGTIPNVPNAILHRECDTLFRTLSSAHACQALTSALRQRAMGRDDKRLLAGLPYSLTQLYYEVPAKARARLFDSSILRAVAAQ